MRHLHFLKSTRDMGTPRQGPQGPSPCCPHVYSMIQQYVPGDLVSLSKPIWIPHNPQDSVKCAWRATSYCLQAFPPSSPKPISFEEHMLGAVLLMSTLQASSPSFPTGLPLQNVCMESVIPYRFSLPPY